MQDIDVTSMPDEKLEDIINVHQPTSHLRTKALNELDRRYKLAESKKSEKILNISKLTLLFAIISASIAFIGVILSIIRAG